MELDQNRGLHAEQEYTFFGPPPRAETRLTRHSRIGEIYIKQGRRSGEMTSAALYTDFHDQPGRPVARAR